MNELGKFTGIANYNGIEYPFVYINEELYLCPGNKEALDKSRSNLFEFFKNISNFKISHEWIPNEYIFAKKSDGKCIVFYTNGEESNSNGFLIFEIQAVFDFSIDDISENPFEEIYIESEELDLFFMPGRLFDVELNINKDDKLKDIHIKTEFDKYPVTELGSYKYKDIEINVKISIYATSDFMSKVPVSASSILKLSFSRHIDYSEVQEVISHVKRFLMFVCYRQNVNLSSIKCYRREKDNRLRNYGELYFNGYNEMPETHRKVKERIFKFKTLENIIANLFQDIADEKAYFEHFPKSIDDRSTVNVSNIILCFAAFEREFNLNYPKSVKRSGTYYDIMKEIEMIVEEKKISAGSKKKRKYYDEIINKINYDSINFGEKIRHAVIANKHILDPFLFFEYQSSDDKTIQVMTTRMNFLRNSIAHGNLGFTIEPIHLSDIRILQLLIFSIRLTNLEVPQDMIMRDLKNLFGINVKL